MAVQTSPRVDASEMPRRRDLLWLPKFLSRHPWVITAVLCVALLIAPVTGGDLAAQEFYGWVFKTHHALLWNNDWYGGHLLAGYSVLFPPLAALIGTRLLGSLAAVAATVATGALLGGPRAALGPRLAGVWFAVGILDPLIVGQLPFLVAVAMGLAALVAVDRRHPWWALVAALATGLTSPLSGAFLLLAALAWCTEIGIRRTAPLAVAAIGVATGSLLGGGGYFPFPLAAFLVLLLFAIGALVLVPDLSRTLRVGLLLYALSAAVLFAVQSPVGGNIGRLGALVGGPLAAAALGSRRRWWSLAVVAVPLLCWQLWPAGTALQRSVGDPSSQAGYYSGLDAFLRTQDVGQGRVEVPTLRQHWEAYYVPKAFPLARGWERQIDLGDNPVLYRPHLTAAALHQWMLRSGVGLVALPDAPLDYWAQGEGALVAAGQPWLQPVWSDAHWRVWRVTDATGLVTGPARVTSLGVDSFTLAASAPGASLVRVHWSPYWQVTSGRACLSAGTGGWTSVVATGPGRVVVTAKWSLSGVTGSTAAGSRCH